MELLEAIRTEHLTKIYRDTTAVNDLNLTVLRGELFALLGINGAGKSTTIRMLATLAEPTSGDAFLLGKSVTRERAAVREFTAVSPQETAIAPNLTVLENLRLIAGIHGLRGEEKNAKIAALTEQFNLGSQLSRRAGKLSGGWQRRLSLAMALVGDPQILFLDEPTLGLDVLARAELWETVRSLKGKVTVILTTHYMEEAEALADRIGILCRGQLLTVGTARELCERTGCERFEDAFIAIAKGAAAQ